MQLGFSFDVVCLKFRIVNQFEPITIETFSALLAIFGNIPVAVGKERWYGALIFCLLLAEQIDEQTMELQVVSDDMALTWLLHG